MTGLIRPGAGDARPGNLWAHAPQLSGRWRCVLVGAESLLLECAALLQERGHEIAAIVSDKVEICDWATARGIPLLSSARALPTLNLPAFDFLFSIANLAILPADVLSLPRVGAINFHDGPLPDYAGINAPIWALLNGERRHGVTWHLMKDVVDAGDILASQSFDLSDEETGLSINTKCFVAGLESFAEMVDGIATGSLATVPQEARQGRYHGLADRPAMAGIIDWRMSARQIVGLVRALDHGRHANPLGLPKFSVDGELFLVRAASIADGASGLAPGTIVSIEGGRLTMASGDGDVVLERLTMSDGKPVDLSERGHASVLQPGRECVSLTNEHALLIGELDAAVARHERWWRRRLQRCQTLLLQQIDRVARSAGGTARSADQLLAGGMGADAETALASLIAYLARIADKSEFSLGFSDPVFTMSFDGVGVWFARQLPLAVRLDFRSGLATLREAVATDICEIHRRIGHAEDLIARSPELSAANGLSRFPVALLLVDQLDDAAPLAGAELTIAMRSDGGACRWIYDETLLSEADVGAMQQGFEALLSAAVIAPDRPIEGLPLLPEEALATFTESWSNAGASWRSDACVHTLFTEQAARTPDQTAVTCRGETLSYGELDQRSNRLARHLKLFGIGPDRLVGLYLERSVHMLVALIAIHKAGGAYVPLDPDYPPDRLAYMINDANAPVIVSQASLSGRLPPTDAQIVHIDRDWPMVMAQSAEPIDGGARPHHLAYVIYTSGSTGRPKGVMVEHRNVVNFFAGMDEKLEPEGTWLAVTSLSFDISVLELCWTLTRGYHVVLATGDELKGTGRLASPARPIDFSLFYFASADGGSGKDNYRLLLEGAKFADANGFAAIWTPERHFHAFGGLYPNPSVTSAAVAAVTERIKIRGGSVVLPLHHPIRIAEEWSLVDNISNGRVGIAFASGWQPNDFVLRPQAYADRSSAFVRDVELVRSLWRGETHAFAGPLGHDVALSIYPRPVQPELPFWITSAGNPETFAAAGRAGASVLTHLLGQTIDELAEKLAIYRNAWSAAKHPGEGHVTLMLHSFVSEDAAQVREAVRQPLIEYLRTSTGLVKQYAWSFPAFKRPTGTSATNDDIDLDSMTAEEMDALLEHSFERYYETSGLFGTPESCLEVIDRVRGIGVDEVACLIDFGVPVAQVLDSLPSLNRLRQLAAVRSAGEEDTLAALMARHGVTHLQCTPTMAQMLAVDPSVRPVLAGLQRMMVGGEAFPSVLARDLQDLVGGSVMNMYGPTETTIWSTVHELDGASSSVPLGRPLANQQICILDSRQQLLPPGIPGELVIGGNGVVRGYLHRPDLTAERFVALPFQDGARAYRTGDLAIQRRDGRLDFLGRLDHQVKIRGYRVELGEIESVLASATGVERAVVIAREDTPGDVRLVGYYVPTGQNPPNVADLRDQLRAYLPDYMIPAHLVALEAVPQTPNGKIARNALPPPMAEITELPEATFTAPTEGTEEQIAAIWRDVLKLPRVGKRDNFFDLGGHSLLAVQVHRRLRANFAQPISITDIFRFPTIEALSAHVSGSGTDDAAVRQGEARALNRRAAMLRRREVNLQVGAGEGS